MVKPSPNRLLQQTNHGQLRISGWLVVGARNVPVCCVRDSVVAISFELALLPR